MTDINKARKPRKSKTAEEKLAAIVAAKAKVAALENKLYADQIDAAITASKIVAAYEHIRSAVKDASDVVVLTAVAKALKIPRLSITQADKQTRRSKT